MLSFFSVSSSLCRPPLSSQCIIVLSSTWFSNLCLSLCTCASLPDQNPALPRQLFKVLVSSTGLPLTMGRVSPYPAPLEFYYLPLKTEVQPRPRHSLKCHQHCPQMKMMVWSMKQLHLQLRIHKYQR